LDPIDWLINTQSRIHIVALGGQAEAICNADVRISMGHREDLQGPINCVRFLVSRLTLQNVLKTFCGRMKMEQVTTDKMYNFVHGCGHLDNVSCIARHGDISHVKDKKSPAEICTLYPSPNFLPVYLKK
jgi:hypothetical protein